MQEVLPLSRRGRRISSTGERSRARSFLPVCASYGRSALGGCCKCVGRGAVGRQRGSRDVHLLSSTIVHLKHEAKMMNTHFQLHFRTNCGDTMNNVQCLKVDEKMALKLFNFHLMFKEDKLP